MTPTSGTTAGGTSVVIGGSGFADATSVSFGAVPVPFSVLSPSTISAVSPPQASGPVQVMVTGPGGTSATGPSSVFTYVEPLPALDGVAAAGGPERVTFVWSPVLDPDVTGVQVEVGSSAAGPWTAAGTSLDADLSRSISGLVDDVTIFVRGRTIGPTRPAGPWSTPIAATPGSITYCGALTRNETWPAELIELTCPVTTAEYTLIIEAGATVESRGLTVGAGGTLVVPGDPALQTVLRSECSLVDTGCSTTAPLTTEAGSHITVRRARIDRQVVYNTGTTVDWSGNTFTASTWRADLGSPRLVGNSFSGADDPVSLQSSADVSGVHDNTATGTPRERVFVYNGASVTGHWIAEGVGTGIIHRIDDLTVAAGGHADWGPGVATKIANLRVATDGQLTATGTTTNPVIATRMCDQTTLGDTVVCWTDPATQANLTFANDATINWNTLDGHDLNITAGNTFIAPTTGPALGTITNTTLDTSTIYEKPASLNWTDNTFTASTWRADLGSPRLVGNSFSGADDPVSLQSSADVSGVHDNTATGTPRERVFVYNGASVTGHWIAEGVGTGIIHRIDDLTVAAGGHADWGPGVATKIANLRVATDGQLTATGTTTNPVIVTRMCDQTTLGDTYVCRTDPATQANLTFANDATINWNTLDGHDLNITAGNTFIAPTTGPALGTITNTTLDTSTIYEKPASLNWTDNTFTASTWRADLGSPRLVGNSFSGADDPVSLQSSADVSGVHDNTATGTPRERVFVYNGASVTGHWIAEGVGTGIIHRIDDLTVAAGGHADWGPGVATKIANLRVATDGQLTATGTTTNPVIATRMCDQTTLGDTVVCWTDPATQANLTFANDATINWNTLDGHDLNITAGNTFEPALGTITNTTLDTSTIYEKPASLDWTDNTFTASTWRADLGDGKLSDNTFTDSEVAAYGCDSMAMTGNNFTRSPVTLQSCTSMNVADNEWTDTTAPLTVESGGDLSGLGPDNRTIGGSLDERRLLLSSTPVAAGASMTLGIDVVYVLASTKIFGSMSVPPSAVVDLDSDLELEAGGALTATDATFRSKDAAVGYKLEADAGSRLTVVGGSIEGWVQGSCDVPYLGGASISVTGVVFSGTAVFQNCNTDATGGPKAIGTGNTGVLYNSSHRNTCVWALPEPVPPPEPYTRRVWDVYVGIPDDPPCLTPGYVEFANPSPGY